MIAEHNSAETATRFIIKTNFEFADMKGKKMGLIIPGSQTSGWIKMAKDEVKDDKKNTCIGDCYVKKNADGSFVLVLLPEKGAAKKNLMIKQLEKFALKGTPFTIEVGAGGELEEDNAADVLIDDVLMPEEGNEVEEAEDDEEENNNFDLNSLQAAAKNLKNNIQSFLNASATEKNQLKNTLLPELKAFEASCEGQKLPETITSFLAKVQQLLQQLEKAPADIQIDLQVESRAKELLEKMSQLMSQLRPIV